MRTEHANSSSSHGGPSQPPQTAAWGLPKPGGIRAAPLAAGSLQPWGAARSVEEHKSKVCVYV